MRECLQFAGHRIARTGGIGGSEARGAAYLLLHEGGGHVGGGRREGREEHEESADDGWDGHETHELNRRVEDRQRALLAVAGRGEELVPPCCDRLLQLDA